jgi:MFS transporter, NRE family, putaive nickel resistance protein
MPGEDRGTQEEPTERQRPTLIGGLGATVGVLSNRVFARLYLAQTSNLLGDALVWVAVALLAFELAGDRAAAVLGIALTMRVAAFVLLSPFAGALADRMSRKALLVGALVARMVVLLLLAGVGEVWQVYALMFALNALTAFFTPTYQATIPAVTGGGSDYRRAVSLSGATFEMLGVLGPGMAGAIAIVIGGRSLFAIAGGMLVIAALLILSVRGRLDTAGTGAEASRRALGWSDLTTGTLRLWRDPLTRYGLSLELVASVAGAWILVNSVVLVKAGLGLGDLQYGWVMAAFGAGATAAALAIGALEGRVARTTFLVLGALIMSLAVLPANHAPILALAALWLVAGAGTNWVNLPMLTILADRTPPHLQGRVYGAHFAWSHLWWLGAYPLAGWLGARLPDASFMVGGALALVLLVLIRLALWPAARRAAIAAGEPLGGGRAADARPDRSAAVPAGGTRETRAADDTATPGGVGYAPAIDEGSE